MAREFGTFLAPANYEPLKAAPFDARALVETQVDLITEETWLVDGGVWVYDGMVVAVSSDIDVSKNGIYILQDAANYQSLNSWVKQANENDIKLLQEEQNNLQEQINQLEIESGGLDVEVDFVEELPIEGNDNTTYYVKENSSIQRWDAENSTYVAYGGAADIDINLIYGGNSHGETN